MMENDVIKEITVSELLQAVPEMPDDQDLVVWLTPDGGKDGEEG